MPMDFCGGSDDKECACDARDLGSVLAPCKHHWPYLWVSVSGLCTPLHPSAHLSLCQCHSVLTTVALQWVFILLLKFICFPKVSCLFLLTFPSDWSSEYCLNCYFQIIFILSIIGQFHRKIYMKFPICIYCFLGTSLETQNLYNIYLLQIRGAFHIWSQIHTFYSTNCRDSSNIL